MTDRKKPGVAFWATVALVVVLITYPLSFGPACSLTHSDEGFIVASRIYWPIGWAGQHSEWIQCLVGKYIGKMLPAKTRVAVPTAPTGDMHILFFAVR